MIIEGLSAKPLHVWYAANVLWSDWNQSTYIGKKRRSNYAIETKMKETQRHQRLCDSDCRNGNRSKPFSLDVSKGLTGNMQSQSYWNIDTADSMNLLSHIDEISGIHCALCFIKKGIHLFSFHNEDECLSLISYILSGS